MKKQLNKALRRGVNYIAAAILTAAGSGQVNAQHVTLNSYSGQTEIKASGSVTLTDGFYIPAGNTVRIFTRPSFQSCTPLSWSPSTNQNYIRTRVFKVAGINVSNINDARSVCEVNQTVQYLDGLGRPLQMVTVQGSPTFRDVVQPVEYDAFGREVKKYLPYVSSLATSNGSYKSSAIIDQITFYNNPAAQSVQGVATIAGTAFSETRFEPSPLNRVLEQGASGASWQLSAGHTQKTEYASNAIGEVKQWEVNSIGASSSKAYDVGTLYKTILKDENWVSGKTGTTEEFKDLEGRVVLKRIWETESAALSTYYLYDDLGNLRYVVPPAVSASSFAESDPAFDQYLYGYHYDGRKRLIEKKIPGKGWEDLVYNKLDQLVLSRDAVQRNNNKWLFTKYDVLGRAVITGIISSSKSRTGWQSDIDGQSTLWESPDKTNANGTGTGYTNGTLPAHAEVAYYHSISYYDDYGFYGYSVAYAAASSVSDKVKSLATGSRVYTLNSSDYLQTVNYYDEEGRLQETIAGNHLGGTDRGINTYSFAGELTSSTRTHIANGATTSIATIYEYDHMGRKLATTENINNQGDVVLSKLSYNELGQLLQKDLHSTDNGNSFLQNTTYAYNERGWLSSSSSGQFSLKLKYDQGSYPQYNGNIALQDWGAAASYPNTFVYQYDPLNRLKNGTSTGIAMSEALTYDVMGNIKTLSRDGVAAGTYNYDGNRLDSISGGALATGTYAYDLNGNAITDGRTGVSLTYNVLNLPATASKSGLSLAYTYDALGRKLKKVSNGLTRHYIDGIEYDGSTIDIIHTEEGVARNIGGAYRYNYNLSDHLGNVRYTFQKNPVTGLIDRLQSDDYYAFGKRRSGSPVSEINKYLYNGKEIQDELGEQYDYGARFYDPVIGRFSTIDPLSEISRRNSPYNYALNNPIRFIDVDGMYADDPPGKGIWNAIKNWWNAPSGNYGVAAQRVVAQSFSARDVPVPETNGDALLMSVAAGAYNMGHSAPGNLKIPAGATNAAADAVEPITLGQRAAEIHGEVPAATQRRTTIAVGEGTDASGNSVRVVGSSEARLRPSQRAALKSGEIEATGKGHAEVTVLNFAKANDIKVQSVGASRPICFNCAWTIQANGVAAVTPLKPVKPLKLAN